MPGVFGDGDRIQDFLDHTVRLVGFQSDADTNDGEDNIKDVVRCDEVAAGEHRLSLGGTLQSQQPARA